MLPKPIRAIFYWILRSGPIGRFIADIISWIFYATVKIFRIPPKQDIAGLTVISHKHKFIFFGIPKVASRSFFNFFIQNHAKDFDIEWYEKRNAFFDAVEKYPDYYKFSFVRNPWSRIVSCYQSKIEDNIIGKRARILSFYNRLKGGMPFNDFVSWLQTDEGQDSIADRHWISQHLFLHDKNGKALCDFVGKYENLDQDWKIISEKIGITYAPLPQKGYISAEGRTENPTNIDDNNQSAQKNKYQSFFNDKTKEMIARRYTKDIEVFKYGFEDE